MTDARSVWARQSGESGRAFEAFTHYRDQGPQRSLDAAWREHRLRCAGAQTSHRRVTTRWAVWSRTWGWVARAAAFDADVERQAREASVHATVQARERHARVSAAALACLTAPIRSLLAALAGPDVLADLTARARSGPDGFTAVLLLACRCASVLPALVQVERLALGLSAEPVAVEHRPNLSLALQITNDPAATELAIALLDTLAGTSSPRVM